MNFLCSWGGLPAVRQPHAAPWGVSDANLGKRVYWHKSSPRFFGRFESLSRPVFQPSADEGSERGFFSAGGDWSVGAERHDSTEGNKKSCCQPYSFLALNRSTLFSTPQVPALREGGGKTLSTLEISISTLEKTVGILVFSVSTFVVAACAARAMRATADGRRRPEGRGEGRSFAAGRQVVNLGR